MDENTKRILLATEYIRVNMNRSITRKEVAQYLHLNEEYFSRLFKKYTGCTFKSYDTTIKIEAAKELLTNSNMSITKIAFEVGYDNFSYFSKVFKKSTGIPPLEYRRSLAN